MTKQNSKQIRHTAIDLLWRWWWLLLIPFTSAIYGLIADFRFLLLALILTFILYPLLILFALLKHL